VKVKDGDIINALDDQLSFLVTYTGIHKADHVWYYEKNNRLLFIGDQIPTPIGLRTLRERHEAEPEIILPGHGKPARLLNLVF
jgi:glyoxylase-like metal-dependent hydrolase (beta-lactamase superfamily II)